MVGNHNINRTKRWQTTNNRLLASYYQFFWFTSNWLEMANTWCSY